MCKGIRLFEVQRSTCVIIAQYYDVNYAETHSMSCPKQRVCDFVRTMHLLAYLLRTKRAPCLFNGTNFAVDLSRGEILIKIGAEVYVPCPLV